MAAPHSLTDRTTAIRILVLSSLCSLCLCGSSFAALDPELKKPYKLTIVLHIAENRQLTELFRERVEYELRDSLQAALGDLAEVTVVRKHPKLAEVLDKDKGLRSLDTWQQRSDIKTHFVLIDFSGVNYEIQARQHDGLTGLATQSLSGQPVVRREKTEDREFVARTAALMVERDFGAIATFSAWPQDNKKPQKIQLELKGSGLEGPLNRWVQKGDVFAVVQVPTSNGMGRLITDAIVQIETPPQTAGDSLCTGNLFWRHKMASSASMAGYRCIKLGATHGPLKVRLVQVNEKGQLRPLPSTPVLHVRRDGFSSKGELHVNSSSKVQGLYDTSKLPNGRFDRVAFVTVYDRKALAEIPIVLLDDQPVVVKMTLKDDETPDADKEKLWWRRSVYDSDAVQSNVFTELLDKNKTRDKLIEIAKEGRKRSEEDLQHLKEERAKVFAGKLTATDQRDLAQADVRIKAIEEGVKELDRYIKRQEAIIMEENSPERIRWKEQILLAEGHEKKLELQKAITIYATILDEGYKSPEMEAHLKKLRDAWNPKNEVHRAARDFIFDIWPGLSTADLLAQVDAAHNALKECRNVRDVIGPRKLHEGIQSHITRLLKEAEGLREINMEDAEQLKIIRDIGVKLTKLEAEIRAYLEKAN